MARVAVIGGGLSGLVAAYRLMRDGPSIDVELFEASDHVGGWIRTEHTDGFVIDRGPEAILTEQPYAVDLANELGLADEIINTNTAHRGAYVVCRGRLERIPDGFVVLGAAHLASLAASPILSVRGKLRATFEPFVPKGSEDDESLYDFVTRRYGRELYERLAQPIAGGIYGGDPRRLSMKAALGKYYALEREAGSVTKGLLRRLAAQRERAAGARYGMFVSFKQGMQALTDALSDALGHRVNLNARVDGLVRGERGWTVGQFNGRSVDVDAVVVALPAARASGLLARVDAELAERLGRIEYGDAATVTFGYEEGAFPQPLDAFGFVVPAVEGLDVMASTWSSVKWQGRAPDGQALIRVFMGGEGREDVLSQDDDALVAMAHDALVELVGVARAPLFHLVDRWQQAMPRYYLGHTSLVDGIFDRVDAIPGLALAGNAYRGVGMPDAIRVANEAAAAVLATVQ